MAKKRKNRKSTRKNRGWTRSYQDPTKARPDTVVYSEMAEQYYNSRGAKNRLLDRRCEERMFSALKHDAFGRLLRHDYSSNFLIGEDIMYSLHEFFRNYGEMHILYIPNGNAPSPRKPRFFPYSDHLCLTRENYGMPFEDFLRCLLGENFTEENEKLNAISDWTDIPVREIKYLYFSSIIPFVRDKSADISSTEQGDLAFCASRTPLEININNARNVNIFR